MVYSNLYSSNLYGIYRYVGLFLKRMLKILSTLFIRFVQLRKIFFTKKPENKIYKGITTDLLKSKVIYKLKYHCHSEYIGKTSQRYYITRDQHINDKCKKMFTKLSF